MTDHAGLYPLPCAHPEMVSKLLQGLVAEPWIDLHADGGSLEISAPTVGTYARTPPEAVGWLIEAAQNRDQFHNECEDLAPNVQQRQT